MGTLDPDGRHFTRTPETHERQRRSALLRAQGWEWHDIATELGYNGPSGASEAARAFYARQDRQTIEDIRNEFSTKLRDLERQTREVMAHKHYVISEGQLVRGPDGQYLIDDGPIYAGIESIRKQMETALKFLPGVAAVTKVRVITDDDIRDALEAERAELAQLESDGDSAST